MTDPRTALFWSFLQVLNRERYQALLKIFGSLAEAAKHVDGELLRGLGCREATIAAALQRMEKCDPEREQKLLEASGGRIITCSEEGYPDRLLDVHDAPVFLFFRGDFSLLRQPCVALVGTRKSSGYGKRVAQEFAGALARANIVTVSGLAIGIDSFVAEETMQAGGRTVAILGQGMLTLSSRASTLADQIVHRGGLILSEFPLRCPPDMFTFPLRNRIIAGVSIATLVLEAPESSGALITAKLAFDYGREVFAIPGQVFDPNFAGCHAIMRKQQARIASSPRHLLEDIGCVLPAEEDVQLTYVPRNEPEERILKALTTMPQSMDILVEKTSLRPGEAGSTLTVLELNGVAKNLGGSQWIKI